MPFVADPSEAISASFYRRSFAGFELSFCDTLVG
jgi:hypothetical protein